MNQDVLEGGDKVISGKEKFSKSPNTKYIGIGIAALIILGGAAYLIFGVLSKPGPVPTPSPTQTVEAWKVKSEKNVKDFLDLWELSLVNANSDQYALKAKDLLTNVGQAKLATLKDDQGKPIAKLSAQLTKFIGVKELPKDFQVVKSEKIDEQNVEVTTYFRYNAMQVLIFKNVAEGGIWLIDSVIDKGIQKVVSPEPSPAATPSPQTS